MKIGELSKKTGLSVRTLHHYDEIGLLRPSTRSEGDHRVYSKDDIEQLQKIVSLKQLGLTLDEISLTLRKSPTLTSILEKHCELIEEELEQKTTLLNRIKSTMAFSNVNQEPTVNELINCLREITALEPFFNKTQIDALLFNSRSLGEEKVKLLTDELQLLMKKMLVEKENQVPPEADHIMEMTKRFIEIRDQFTKGQPEFEMNKEKLKEAASSTAAQHGIDVGLLDYIQRSASALKNLKMRARD
jgi:DNA-binding transcriptional MerR regulator